jgi:pilus assembly protein CpaF
VIVQAARLRDGSRRITHITEVVGMEGDVIITQDLFVYDIVGEDAKIIGRHRQLPVPTHRYYGEEAPLEPASTRPDWSWISRCSSLPRSWSGWCCSC